MDSAIFLSKKQVLLLHYAVIEKYGGSHGMRDEGLLDSALGMAKSGFGNEYFHKSIFNKATAYLYHLVKNHPFTDGNKRIGFACMDMFLSANGYTLKNEKNSEIYEFIIKVATDKSLSKEQISLFIENNSTKKK